MNPAFNEISIDSFCPDAYVARLRMRLVVDTLKRLKHERFGNGIHVSRDLLSRQLATDYGVSHYLNDKKVDRDERLYFKATITKLNYTDDLIAVDSQNQIDVLYNGKKGLGIDYAYKSDGFVVSLGCLGDFDQPKIPLEIVKLDPTCEIHESNDSVRNLSTPNHIDFHLALFQAKFQTSILTGRQLVQEMNYNFSHLVLCKDANVQLLNLSGNELYFHHILHVFQVLNNTASTWENGEFSPLGITWTNDSQPTLKHRIFGPMRSFELPDGRKKQFSAHAKITPYNIRLYFWFDTIIRKVYIGYVGKHLPTVNHPTP
jgi:hypothetical protein